MADQQHSRRAHNFKDISGQRFGRLTIVAFDRTENRRAFWRCLCDCGNMTIVIGKDLRSGHTVSCGCFDRERRIVHGHARKNGRKKLWTRTYKAWMNAKRRCYDSRTKWFHLYGGRGIRVCDRWRDSFENFLADMGECPQGLELDRYPDQSGNYEPGNCRWASKKQQGRNTRMNHLVTVNGETLTLTEWAERLGATYYTLRDRLRRGWSLEKTVSTPIHHR